MTDPQAREALEALRRTVAEARAMPMSSSVVVNRAELLERLAAVEEAVTTAAARSATADADPAQDAAERLRRETDDYVDRRLASFEVTLERTLHTVRRGRERLAGRSDLDALSGGGGDITLSEHLGG